MTDQETPFVWRDDYILGDTLIDSQHKQLLVLANLLAEACRHQRDPVIVNQSFDALTRYVRQHFRDEEDLIKVRQPDRLDRHHRLHVELAGDLRRIQKGFRTNVIADPLESLKDWVHEKLIPHMVDNDRAALAELNRESDA